MPDQTPCPVCSAIPVPTDARADRLNVDCPHCGAFSISGSTIATLPALIGKDRRKAVLIGHELRQAQMNGDRPLLTADAAKTILEKATLPTVSAQADNLVQWLGDNSPDVGRMVTISLEEHGAIIGMTGIAGLHLILGGLRDQGLIKWYATMGTSQSLHLTFHGVERYEALRNAVPKATSHFLAPVGHRHAAILSTDIVGFSSLMAADESGTLISRSTSEAAVRQVVEANKGRFVKSTGDGTLSAFGSTFDAMQAALEILRVAAQQNTQRPPEKGIVLRIGLAVGDVVDEGSDIFGDCVNLAARLQAEAAPGTICTLEHVCDDLANKMTLACEELGLSQLKGIARRVRIVQVRQE